MRIRANSFILALALGLAALPAQAIPILWTLGGVTFNDGGTASGSFVFEADTNVFSMISIMTTAGTTLSGASYSDDHPFFGTSFQPVFISGLGADLTGETLLAFVLSAGMTNAGGTIALFISSGTFEGTCTLAACSGGDAFVPLRQMTGGSITAAVPEPGTLALLGLGLFVMGLARRRKKI